MPWLAAHPYLSDTSDVSRFRQFFRYYCLCGDFPWANQVWPFTLEDCHLWASNNDNAIKFAPNIRKGRASGPHVYSEILHSRPYPYFRYDHTSDGSVVWKHFPFLPDLVSLHSASFFTSDVIDLLYEGSGLSAWKRKSYNGPQGNLDEFTKNTDFRFQNNSWHQGAEAARLVYTSTPRTKLEREVVSHFQEKLHSWKWDAEDANEFWHYSTSMWNALYDLETLRMVPDILIRLERIEKGVHELCEILGVSNAEKYLKSAYSSRRARNASPNRDSSKSFMDYYSDVDFAIAEACLLEDMNAFGYTIEGKVSDDSRLILNGGGMTSFSPPDSSMRKFKWKI